MVKSSWAAVVRQVHQRAQNRCEYCQTAQYVIGQALHVEHISPDGGDDLDNLCLACANCNLSKGQATLAVDPETDTLTPLFNPRRQIWSEHFQWRQDGAIIAGQTAVGRATVDRLQMNRPRIVEARSIWIIAGVHPPHD